jgi:hypothetical protein
MRLSLVTVAAVSALLAAGGCRRADPHRAGEGAVAGRRLTIVYLADLAGQLEPCGCSANQRGGLARASEVLKRVRAENPNTLFFAGGDLLFDHLPKEQPERGQELRKAEAVAEALRAMGLAATTAGERDKLAGDAFMKATGLPFVAQTTLGAVAFGEWPPEANAQPKPGVQVHLAVAHKGGTKGALPQAQAARDRGIQVLLGAHRDNILSDDANRALLEAAVPVLQTQGRGQSLARIDIQLVGDPAKGFAVLKGPAQKAEEIDLLHQRKLDYIRRRQAAEAAGNGELFQALETKLGEIEQRVKELETTPLPAPPTDRPSLTIGFIPITDDLPEEPGVRGIIERYNVEVGKLNLAAAMAKERPCPKPRPGQPFFIGMEEVPPGGQSSCRDCHAAAYDFWKGTGHAHAFHTLEAKGRQFDLDCVKCHVTGWGQPGGLCSVARPDKRKDVQCESCHGAASAHALDPPGNIVADPGEANCKTCHTPENSTGFEFTSFRKRIVGPGHGAPVQ